MSIRIVNVSIGFGGGGGGASSPSTPVIPDPVDPVDPPIPEVKGQFLWVENQFEWNSIDE